MSRKQQSFHRRSTQEEERRSNSYRHTAHHSHKPHSTLRHSRPRASRGSQPFRDFVSNPLGSFSNPVERWWYVGIVGLTLFGGICGSFFLPGGLFGLNNVRIGMAVFFLLGALLKAIINEIRATSYSR
ncbi:MAG: hypothetical protein ACRDHW_10405, partial [Ktedonobacteraceae bacterium]